MMTLIFSGVHAHSGALRHGTEVRELLATLGIVGHRSTCCGSSDHLGTYPNHKYSSLYSVVYSIPAALKLRSEIGGKLG